MTDDRNDAQPWLDLLERAEKELSAWQSAADSIDRAYAKLEQLRHLQRDREYQLFWSNIAVMGPSIYARPPVPVVTPKFKDRRPIYRTSAEFLERACVVSFDQADIDQTMTALRDDLVISGRGTAWVRFESDEDGDRVCYDHVDRKDFRHDPARAWPDVDWVARRAWLTEAEAKERFGDAADNLPMGDQSADRGDRNRLNGKYGVWEIWCRSERCVVWVADGCEVVLDRSEPHLKLAGFFPCPRPAYATVERRSLVPVPDMLLYKDQLEEVNDLTRRIHALSDAVKVRGFYAAGGDVGAAIERAILMNDDGQVMVPVPNLNTLIQGSGGDPIVWLPIDMISTTVTALVELRRQVIEDVYQIMGMSDIMRGFTETGETATAQRLKQQNGSFRVRDKQQELARVARDLVRIGAEIMAEEFRIDDLTDMAQMDLPTNADVKKQIANMKSDCQKELQELLGQAEQQPPQQGQDQQQVAQQFAVKQKQILDGWSKRIKQASEQVTIDQVKEFLRDEKLRPFVLDIETDSTIYPDEAAEKQARSEFMTAFAGSLQALQGLMGLGPEGVKLAGAVWKFALSPYRVGRELESLIDDFADQGPQIAQQLQAQAQRGQSEEMTQAALQMSQAELVKSQAETVKARAAGEKVQAEAQIKMQELQLRAQEAQAEFAQDRQRFALEVEQTRGNVAETSARIEKIYAEIQKLGVDASNQTRQQDREDARTVADVQARQVDQAMSAQDRQRQAIEGERNAARSDRAEDRADRQQALAERTPE